MKVYIVFGQYGEYSDHTDWIVKGFASKAKAEALEHECMLWAHKNQEHQYGPEWNELLKQCPDPHFNTNYTGTDYYTVEVDVEE